MLIAMGERFAKPTAVKQQGLKTLKGVKTISPVRSFRGRPM